ncbi:SDR family oxidoreductase [bacterium]|nr:SDR family oxidoreductase [bacterium]
MKILITGGAGFIASHIADAYIELGHSVIIVDDLSTGFEENINPKAKFYKLDIRDLEGLREIFEKEKPEIVNHHAAQIDVRKSLKDFIFDADVNIMGSLNLLKLSLDYGVKKFIFASTGGAIYGEPLYIPADEKHPALPLSPYGAAKLSIEHYLYVFHQNFSLPYISLRYANVYGPRQNPLGEAGVVAIFTDKMVKGERPIIFGDGKQTRDFVYIKDVVSANIIALKTETVGVFNIGTGQRTSVNEVFRKIKDALDEEIEPIYAEERKGEVKHIALDCSLAEKELGWRPQYDFDSGLKETIEFYKKLRNA